MSSRPCIRNPALAGGALTAGAQYRPTGPVSANDARRRARVEPAVLTVFRPGQSRRTTSASSARLASDSGRPMTFIADRSAREIRDLATRANVIRDRAQTMILLATRFHMGSSTLE